MPSSVRFVAPKRCNDPKVGNDVIAFISDDEVCKFSMGLFKQNKYPKLKLDP